HPEDVDAMARLFVRFRNFSYVAKAIDIWANADKEIEKLQDAAARLNAEVRGARDPARIGALLDEIEASNGRLSPLEDAFSFTLGEATRWMRDVLFVVLLVAALLLVAAAGLRTRAQLRSADAAEWGKRESEERL